MRDDLRTLRDLFGKALRRSGLASRRLEEELGIGHGNLNRLLNGELDIKVRHLLAIARFLKVPPHRFLELGCPEAEAAATHDLSDWLGESALPASGRDEQLRTLIREELARALEGSVLQGESSRKRPAGGG